MNALLILIPVSLLLVGFAAAVFFWAVRHQQFDDLDTPEVMPLLDLPEAPTAAAGADADPDQDEPGSAAARSDAGSPRDPHRADPGEHHHAG